MASLQFIVVELVLLTQGLLAAANSLTYHNLGSTSISVVYNPGTGCAQMNMIDVIPPGGELTQNHENLTATCGNGQWNGMVRGIEGDYSNSSPSDIQELLGKADAAGSILAEVCFVTFSGLSFYDTSRVNLPCTPSNVGVKWMYPAGSTDPAHQSGCGQMNNCWNMYTYPANDWMQLSHASVDYIVILGDNEETYCDPHGSMECCTAPGGCVPNHPNTPVPIRSCPVSPAQAATASPPPAAASPSTSAVATSHAAPSSSKASQLAAGPLSAVAKVPAPIASAPAPAPTVPAQGPVIVTATDWVTVTAYTTETVCPGPYGCASSYDSAIPMPSLKVKRERELLQHHHKHARGVGHGH